MIKLFLITLLCATLVFADLPVQDFQAWKGSVNRFLSTMEHGSSSLVRQSANRGLPEGGPGRGPPGGGPPGGGPLGRGPPEGEPPGGGGSGGASEGASGGASGGGSEGGSGRGSGGAAGEIQMKGGAGAGSK